MSKLVYPNNGIYNCSRNDIETVIGDLSRIISNCNLDIPSNFAYRSYLANLDSTIREYYNEIKSINYRLQHSDNNYETLENDLISNTKRMSTIKITERDRMII